MITTTHEVAVDGIGPERFRHRPGRDVRRAA
jgi:hypothetical protein